MNVVISGVPCQTKELRIINLHLLDAPWMPGAVLLDDFTLSCPEVQFLPFSQLFQILWYFTRIFESFFIVSYYQTELLSYYLFILQSGVFLSACLSSVVFSILRVVQPSLQSNFRRFTKFQKETSTHMH